MRHKILLFLNLVLVFVCFTVAPGCQAVAPAKPTVQQGNVLTEATIQQVKVGMSKEQIIALLGSPVMTNLFNENEWDYVYSIKKDKKPLEHRKFTLLFANDVVARITK